MKPIFLIIFALCCLLPLRAQNTTRSDSLMNRELILEKEYNPTIRDAVKISQFPELREPKASKSAVEFSNYTTPYDVRSKPVPLSPQAYLTDMNFSKYRGYLTGGISSLIDIDGDLGYRILDSDQDRLSAFLSHRSSACNVSYLQNVSYSQETGKQQFKINDNWGGLNYMHDFGDIKFLADAKYTYSAFNYYGLTVGTFNKSSNQVDRLLEACLGISSERRGEFDYKINIGYTNFQQKYGGSIGESGSKENRVLIDGDIRKMISSSMGVDLSGFIKTYSYSNRFRILNKSTTNYWTFSLKPSIYWEDININFLLGAKMEVEVGGRKKVVVSPAVRFNYYPSSWLLFYLLADGGRKDNSLYNLFYENRYVDPLIRVMDSRSPLDATAGVKFTPLSTMNVDIFGGYTIMKDEHFFYPNMGTGSYFVDGVSMLSGNGMAPIYENANTLKLGTDIKYTFQDIYELEIKGVYYHRMISADRNRNYAIPRRAWNKPDFEINLNGYYRLPGLPLRFDLSYLGAYGRKAIDSSNSLRVIKMNDIHDLSGKVTYSFTPNFSVYVSSNNTLFSRYDLWWGYPAQGFNIMGGLSVLF